MRSLVVHPGTAAERRYPLKGPVTVGRGEDCDVFVPAASLSRRHARFEPCDEGARVVDLQSKNGTFVNERAVREAVVRAGDVVRLGDVPVTIVEALSGPMPSIVRPLADLRADPADTHEAAARLRILLDVATTLATPRPLDGLLERIVELSTRILAVDRAALLLLDAESGALEARVWWPREMRVAFPQSIARWVLARRAAALFDDALDDPRVADARSVREGSIRSSMAAPVAFGDRVFGVLYVDNLAAPRRFAAADVELLAAFANQAAIALENAGLRRRLEAEAVARSALQRFFPPATRDRILAANGAVEVVETDITAVFCDISDYTAMAADMAPRDVIAMLNRYFPAVSEPVFALGGTLEKYIGDAVLAVWGAPVARPDDPDRALEAALRMRAAVAALGADPGVPRLRVHFGVHAGRVAAGNIGSPEYLQYATIGDATNIAARLCGVAEAGEIAVSDEVWRRLASPPAGAVRIEGVRVKGRAAPLTVWKL